MLGLQRNGQLRRWHAHACKTPVDVFGLSGGVAAISAGWDHTCALLNTGGVMCWGNNWHGESATARTRTP